MSHQELAEAVNAYLWDTYHRHENLDENDIGKLERGEHRWPGARRREAFRAVLRVATDAELGFYIRRGRKPENAALLVHAESVPPALPDRQISCRLHDRPGDFPGGDDAEELRDRLLNAAAVDAGAIALLATQADRIREVDRMLGARAAEAQMRGHLEALSLLRSFTVSANQREALADLYADAGALAGWQCLDLGDLPASWRYHDAARNAGHEGRSLAPLVHAIAQQAYVLVELGELASATQLAEYAGAVAGSAVPPLLQSWLWAVRGELHAVKGSDAACRVAFETASRLLPDEAHDPELPYIVLSEVHLARWRGNAFAMLGDAAATDDLQRALSGLDPSFTRAKGGLHVDLAWALAAANRYAEASAELCEAKTLAIRVGSSRQRRRVRRLESVLGTG